VRLSPDDLLAVEREYCKRSLGNFVKRAWPVLEPGSELKWGWVLDAICEHLEAVTAGEIKQLLINVPPGSMKSLLTSVMWPAWEWGPRDMGHIRYVATAHSERLALRDNLKCRRLIKSDWYQKLWPLELRSDQNSKGKFENSKTGVREAMPFQSITGTRGDRIILDDPHSVDDANSMAKLTSQTTLFSEALTTRFNNDKSATVIIMQRLNIEDIAAKAIEFGYEHLMIPMRFDEARKCTTSIGWEDPRTKDGELMFPERFSEAKVAQMEARMGSYAVASQFQQTPVPRGGALFKMDKFGSYRELPPLRWRAIFADTAQKTATHNDYSVLQLWGKATDRALGIYLIDQIRGKWTAPQLEKAALQFYDKHMPNLRCMYIEDKSSGTGLIQSLQRGGILVKEIPRTTDKYTRGCDASIPIENGMVHLPHDASFLKELLHELQIFDGKGGNHDDQVDPMMDAIEIMIKTDNSAQIEGFFRG